ncbi:MAG: bifunctional precorrin-2 dehydrogenase/sirohydrochlorin ferrochelatase [Deltaproteobacteria bacterium]|nr:bifunctional precorrin-2 dehydrogenase/sirohydrochlorin ferrochelatase [Deltaproteobacteria bacterium]
MENRLFPAFLKLDGVACLVVGGGAVAEQKIAQLERAAAVITVVSPELTPALAARASASASAGAGAGEGALRWVPRTFQEGDLAGARLVICATDDEALNRSVGALAERHGLFVNVVDRPALCSFFMGATLRRGDLAVTVSTNGQSPALAAKIRDEIDRTLGPEWDALLEICGALREQARSRLTGDWSRRRAFFARMVSDESLALLRQGKRAELLAQIERWFDEV